VTVTLWVLLALVVALGAWLIGTYNGLVARRQRTHQAFADVDVQLRLRHDLVPNLVEVVRGYAGHEREALEAVVRARAVALGEDRGSEAQSGAERTLGRALGRLVALAEAYPDLKADQGFRHLQQELSDIENKLAAARRFFNNAVAEYNAAVESFPAVLVASRFGFAARAFFELDETTRSRLELPPSARM
jgi:LemA protein